MPKKPYKNLEEFLTSYRNVDGFLKCPFCNGGGRVIHPDATPDVIEGHKLSKTIKCPLCMGSKIAESSSYYERYYKIELEKWKDAKLKWKEETDYWWALEKEYTIDEIRIIKRTLEGMK